MHHFTPLPSLFGGLLIGGAAALLYVFNGRIAGISGIAGGLLRPRRGEVAWRGWFVAGLLAGGALWGWFDPSAFGQGPRSTTALVAAGLAVGAGTQWSNGCTSGHGICGLGRFSARSVIAVATFMVTAAVTVAVTHQPRTSEAVTR